MSDSSVYREDDDYHSIESEDPVDHDYIDNDSSHATHDAIYPAHVCMAGSASATSSAERRTIGVTQTAWGKAKDAVEKSIEIGRASCRERV